jgi:hypothetical protein
MSENLKKVAQNLRNNKILKETYVVKIIKRIESLVVFLDNKRSPCFRNALAALASTLFSGYKNEGIGKLSLYICYPSMIGNNIKKRNDYISGVYVEMLTYDDTKTDIALLKKIETKLSKLTKLI